MDNKFLQLIKSQTVILDGATGTNLQPLGLSGCPEQWVINNPSALIDLQKKYVESGSNAVYTCTLGANRIKLDEYGLGNETVAINKRLVEISRHAVGDNIFLGGDVGPTGQFVEPFGQLDFEAAVNCYKEQITALAAAGVDFIIIETMLDLQESRAALIAAKECCDLPVLVSLTYESSGRTLTGTDAKTALITLQSLGADAVGCNCSTGPKEMLPLVESMREYAKVPLVIKPNAGLPVSTGGSTTFDMDADTFILWMRQLYTAGASILGGCCGTTPEYIKMLSATLGDLPKSPKKIESFSALTSSTQTTMVGGRVCVVGERINPTGKKAFQASLKEGSMDKVLEFAKKQENEGAHVLDVNMGMAGIDEVAMLKKAVLTLSSASKLPLSIDTANPSALESALRVYPGRALINSIPAGDDDLQHRLSIAKKYGAMFILLPLGKSIPATAVERMGLVDNAIEQANLLGIPNEDIVVDGLTMAVSSDAHAATETLRVVRACTKRSLHTILGLSNISFGLPEREWLNAAMLAMAVENGLDMAICNPASASLRAIRLSCDLLRGNDLDANKYVSAMAPRQDSVPEKSEGIHSAVVSGDTHRITTLVKDALEISDARTIIDTQIIPALDKVGDFFETGVYFLPQLMRSAQTVQLAFEILEPLLSACDTESRPGTIVLATVKGDVHDIGKNIVGMMMKSHGFIVHDLGKDVPAQEIIEKAKQLDADIIGLSALLTTTLDQMRIVTKMAEEADLRAKIMVGGAAVTKDFADSINAHCYAKDANEAVILAKQIM